MAWKIAYPGHSRGSRGNLRHPGQLIPRVSGWGYTCSQTVQHLVTFTRVRMESILSSFILLSFSGWYISVRFWLEVQFYLSPLKSKQNVLHLLFQKKGLSVKQTLFWFLAIGSNCQCYLADMLVPRTRFTWKGWSLLIWRSRMDGPHLC
jgi:hypothetical protein